MENYSIRIQSCQSVQLNFHSTENIDPHLTSPFTLIVSQTWFARIYAMSRSNVSMCPWMISPCSDRWRIELLLPIEMAQNAQIKRTLFGAGAFLGIFMRLCSFVILRQILCTIDCTFVRIQFRIHFSMEFRFARFGVRFACTQTPTVYWSNESKRNHQ